MEAPPARAPRTEAVSRAPTTTNASPRRPRRPSRRPPPVAPLPMGTLEQMGAWQEYYLSRSLALREAARQGGWTTDDVVEETCLDGHISQTTTRPPFVTRANAFFRRAAAHPVVAAFDLKLLAKLCAVVALLGHDGDAYRVGVLSCLAVLTFLVQTGVARILAEALFPGRLNSTTFSFLNSTEVAEEDTPPDIRPQTASRALARAALTGHVLSHEDLPRSLAFDLPLLFLTFLLSLAPAWRVVARPLQRPHQD